MNTEITKALRDFERALGIAWLADCNDRTSDARLREVWEKADAARIVLKKAIDRLEENPPTTTAGPAGETYATSNAMTIA